MQRFHCYLLWSTTSSAAPRQLRYIGMTVDPRRRLRQHNGELAGGARATRGKGPWRFALVLAGLPSMREALRAEWRWKRIARSRCAGASAGSGNRGRGRGRRRNRSIGGGAGDVVDTKGMDAASIAVVRLAAFLETMGGGGTADASDVDEDIDAGAEEDIDAGADALEALEAIDSGAAVAAAATGCTAGRGWTSNSESDVSQQRITFHMSADIAPAAALRFTAAALALGWTDGGEPYNPNYGCDA